MKPTVILTKSGPRLIDLYVDEQELHIVVNGPGMLYSSLDFMINRSVVDGASFSFFRDIADGLEAIVDCPHSPIRRAPITVESHRLGAELSINLGPPNMYQSEVRLRTSGGGTFRRLIDEALRDHYDAQNGHQELVAVLVAVRATGHHEHYASPQVPHEAGERRSPMPDAHVNHRSNVDHRETSGGQQQ